MWYCRFRWSNNCGLVDVFQGPFRSRTEAVTALFQSLPDEADACEAEEDMINGEEYVDYDEYSCRVYQEEFRG